MSVAGMNHFTVLTDDVEGTARFYHDLLGLTVGPRPNFDFPGAWLYFGDQPILHLIGGRSTTSCWRRRHWTRARITSKRSLAYGRSAVANTSRWAPTTACSSSPWSASTWS